MSLAKYCDHQKIEWSSSESIYVYTALNLMDEWWAIDGQLMGLTDEVMFIVAIIAFAWTDAAEMREAKNWLINARSMCRSENTGFMWHNLFITWYFCLLPVTGIIAEAWQFVYGGLAQ